MKNWRTWSVLTGLAIVLVYSQYRRWLESGGIYDMARLKQALAAQEKINDKLQKGNDALLFQIQRLRYSNDSIESRARNELGMIKKDETFYQVVKKSPKG